MPLRHIGVHGFTFARMDKCSTQFYDQQRATVHNDVKRQHLHLERGTKQEDTLNTLLFNSPLQYIMKPLAEKWNRDNHGDKRVEHDPDTNRPNLGFADDILISSSLEHTITMLHDLTTAHGQPHKNENHPHHDSKEQPTRKQTAEWQQASCVGRVAWMSGGRGLNSAFQLVDGQSYI